MPSQDNGSANGKSPRGAALVVGAGIAGMQAALDLAEAGIKVYLLDRAPAIGGTMAQLDKTFPTNDCAMCIMSPKLVEVGRHLNIELLNCADVEFDIRRARRFHRHYPPAPALRGLEKVHRLRRLCGCLPDLLAGPIQWRSLAAQSGLQALPAGNSQRFCNRETRGRPMPGCLPDSPKSTGLCRFDCRRALCRRLPHDRGR